MQIKLNKNCPNVIGECQPISEHIRLSRARDSCVRLSDGRANAIQKVSLLTAMEIGVRQKLDRGGLTELFRISYAQSIFCPRRFPVMSSRSKQ